MTFFLQNIIHIALLNFVAILWGTQHVCIKTSIESYDSTSLLNFWRFWLSTLLFSRPLVQSLFVSPIDSVTLKAGFELGIWTFLGFGFQVGTFDSLPYTFIYLIFEFNIIYCIDIYLNMFINILVYSIVYYYHFFIYLTRRLA